MHSYYKLQYIMSVIIIIIKKYYYRYLENMNEELYNIMCMQRYVIITTNVVARFAWMIKYFSDVKKKLQ